MRIVRTRVAVQDRRAICEYIATDNTRAAAVWDTQVATKIGRLAKYPEMGRPGRVPGTRELVAHPNYVVVYDIAGESVRIPRVLHAARQWPPPAD